MTDSVASDCVFCKIVRGEIPASIVHHGDRVTAFRDVNPQAPVHVLIVPNLHVAHTSALESQHDNMVGAMVRVAADVAVEEGVAESGYRLVFNTGEHAGNTVPHLHLHLLGGRAMGWPPG